MTSPNMYQIGEKLYLARMPVATVEILEYLEDGRILVGYWEGGKLARRTKCSTAHLGRIARRAPWESQASARKRRYWAKVMAGR